ncbi:MAG TPA: DsbA family oxidoreductase [Alphaproteobacteria bacterium]|nr:DsbA family oxidoreductase [Alphaproteobacteria bacterium]
MDIDIYFDLVCPWCYIGKRRLERALAAQPDLKPAIRWQPFQLNPGMPRPGMDRATYLAAKFGGPERARQVYAMVADTAARDGLDLKIDRIVRTPNTLDAHRLVRWSSEPSAMVEAVFKAYFEDGRDIGDIDVLSDIAAAQGFDPEATRAHLLSEADTDDVQAADAEARRMGIQAVPCFVFDRRYALSGAQEPHAFEPMFDLAKSDADPALSSRSS